MHYMTGPLENRPKWQKFAIEKPKSGLLRRSGARTPPNRGDLPDVSHPAVMIRFV